MPGVWLETRYAAQNQTLSGVCERSITVPTVRPVFFRQLRQRRTPGRFAKHAGDPAMWADEHRLQTSFFEVNSASRLVGEQALKPRPRLREGQVVPLNYIHHTAAMARGF